jgi:ABC-type multidrug transport system ATPase subunit
MAIDFSAKAFPSFRPALKLEDDAPLVRPVVVSELPAAESMATPRRFLTGFLGLAIGGLALGAVVNVRRRTSLEFDPDLESAVIPSPNGVPQEMKQDRKSIVTVNNLTKRYGDTKAIDEISFSIARGESIALWGPNGAGKTTILRCLLGIARFTGDVEVGGFRSNKEGRQARGIIGYVPQELAAPELTVGEMSEFIAKLKHVPYDDAFSRLEQLSIADQVDKQISALSGGMKQRLALALALIGDPQILLLDEPTANLDARGRGELIELLKELKQQDMTLIFSSHRPEDVLLLADRILIVEQGKLASETTPNQFLADLGAHTHLVVYLDEAMATGAQQELEQLGYRVVRNGSTLSIPVDMQQKAQVIGVLIAKGYVVEDFELERGT